MLNRLWQAHLRRQDRKLWRAVCTELGIAYAEPVATGSVDGLVVEIQVAERNRPTRIMTGLPDAVGFGARTDAPAAPELGDMWFDASVALRGDLALWLRALDRDTRKTLGDLVQYSAATLLGGVFGLRESLRVSVTNPTVAERVGPIRAAALLAKRLLATVESDDDSALYEACRRRSQRERLTALTLVRTQRADDPRTKALLAEFDADADPDTQMLVALSAARWARVAEYGVDGRFGARLLCDTVATLRALYPRVDTLPAVAAFDDSFRDRKTPIAPDKYATTAGPAMSIAIARTALYNQLDREPASRATMAAALKAICTAI